jgi:5,10-methylenetetrahydrofolate reductase
VHDTVSTVVEIFNSKHPAPVFLCDFSPPRGPDVAGLDPARQLDADFICIAYSPGKSVRVDSMAAAVYLQRFLGKRAIFNLSPRDMNKLALQTHLVGAQVLGVPNVLVIQGDSFSEKEKGLVKPVLDFKAVEFIASITAMNAGTDFRGLKLRQAAALCAGAAVDLTKPAAAEAALTRRKVEAGAQFLVTQLVFGFQQIRAWLDAYERIANKPLELPVFYGLPVLEKESLIYGEMPTQVRRDLDQGRPGSEIAYELFESLRQEGLRGFYVIPPILRGGARNYDAARDFFARCGRGL